MRAAISEEVAAALRGRAVVGLETGFVASMSPDRALAAIHGMEDAVRKAGAVPALTWVEGPVVRVGAGPGDAERLVGRGPRKLSSRDLAVAAALNVLGVTTISATLRIAATVGMEVCASAGLGGVHRGAADSMDISGDLLELTRVPVALVCAGIKPSLDVPATLEVLETQGVPVLTVATDEFPAFICTTSGIRTPWRVDSLVDVANAIRAQRGWGMGMVIAAPIAAADAVPHDRIDAVIDAAVARAEREGVRGPALTPFLMRAIEAGTDGISIAANSAALVQTAALGGRIVRVLAGLREAA